MFAHEKKMHGSEDKKNASKAVQKCRRCVSFSFFKQSPEPDFLNFYGAQESIPRNQSRQAWPGGRYDSPFPTWFLAHIDCLKLPALHDNLRRNSAFSDTVKKALNIRTVMIFIIKFLCRCIRTCKTYVL
jgi:hypothetical protein